MANGQAADARADDIAERAEGGPPVRSWRDRFGWPRVLRIAALIALLVGLGVVSHVTGLDEQVDVEHLRGWMQAAGPWGYVLFIAAFAVGELLHIWGMIFILAAVAAYGPWVGLGLSYVGAVGAVCFSFVVVRAVGGRALKALPWAFAQRMLEGLEHRPVITIVLLRSVLMMAPALNYTLALTDVKFRHYFLGSAIGLVGPVALIVYGGDALFKALGWA
ncbi:MAG: TVP38/TMEM64 family protein [Sandaracinaceae bacterium]